MEIGSEAYENRNMYRGFNACWHHHGVETDRVPMSNSVRLGGWGRRSRYFVEDATFVLLIDRLMKQKPSLSCSPLWASGAIFRCARASCRAVGVSGNSPPSVVLEHRALDSQFVDRCGITPASAYYFATYSCVRRLGARFGDSSVSSVMSV